MTTTPIAWPEAQRICDIPEVREALDKFAVDAHEEHMLAMVSAIIGHASAQGRAAGLEEERAAFEKQFTPESSDPAFWMRRTRNGDYSNAAMQSAWQGWKARTTLKVADPIRQLIALHADELEGNDYAYFELARHRRTDWMAWICTNVIDSDPGRKVLAQGQGATPDEACAAAVADYHARALSSLEVIGKGEKG